MAAESAVHDPPQALTRMYPTADIGGETPPIRRIVFLGDSITECGEYVVDLECWLLAHRRQIEVLNVGLSSETATALSPVENEGHLKQFGFVRPFVGERLARVLAETKPDCLFVCYGMNDAGALPRTEQGTKRYTEAMTLLRGAALHSGAKRVVICTPPMHDAKGVVEKQSYDDTLARYSAWLVCRRQKGWEIVDLHTPMRTALREGRSRDPAFAFALDGVHPGRAGHWLMAREILTHIFGAHLCGVTSAENLFFAQGPEIRVLVRRRMEFRFNTWMALICHQRPGVMGGPDMKNEPRLAAAQAAVADCTLQINHNIHNGLPLAERGDSG